MDDNTLRLRGTRGKPEAHGGLTVDSAFDNHMKLAAAVLLSDLTQAWQVGFAADKHDTVDGVTVGEGL
jgi:hypothetical protein